MFIPTHFIAVVTDPQNDQTPALLKQNFPHISPQKNGFGKDAKASKAGPFQEGLGRDVVFGKTEICQGSEITDLERGFMNLRVIWCGMRP